MRLARVVAKAAKAAVVGVDASAVAQQMPRVARAVDRGAAKFVRAGNAKLEQLVKRVRERRAS